MERNEEIRKVLIAVIRERGFPVGTMCAEADSFGGLYARSEDEVQILGPYGDIFVTTGELGDGLVVKMENLNDRGLFYLAYGETKGTEFIEIKEMADEESGGQFK